MAETSHTHSVNIVREKCIGCVACMKACPTKAIRVGEDQKAKIIYEKCIDCGECLRACSFSAVVPITTKKSDLERFKFKVALTSPVIYSQFGHNVMPGEILPVVKELGFDYVYDVTLMCEMISRVIREYLKEYRANRPIISSACPVVVRLIQRLFPSLCELILPVEPPREMAAKNLRQEISRKEKIPKKDIGIFHITPCAAKIVSINYPESMEKSYLDGAISIKDIYNRVMMKLNKSELPWMIQPQTPLSGIGLGWALPGGEMRSLKYHSVSVSGVLDTIRILQDVEAGKLRDFEYLECLICPDGCIGGPLTAENRFVAKSNILRLIRGYAGRKMVETEKVKKLYKEGFFSFKSSVKPKPFPPLDKNRRRALQKLQLKEEMINKLPGVDCGVCGAPDCKTFADDIARGMTKLTNCRFFKNQAATAVQKETGKVIKKKGR